MILKSIQKIFAIAKAKIKKRQPHTEDWQIERKKICDGCEFNSKNYNKKKNLWYRIWELLNLNEPFCKICKCELHLKQQFELEECDKGKWKQHI